MQQITNSALKRQLATGAAALKLSLTVEQLDKLVAYLQLLVKWNSAYNLTAVRDIKAMIPKHLIDSLSIANYIQGKRIMDVGSGAGLPGIPLALVFPDRQFILLDSNGKKTRFLLQAKIALNLMNVEVVQARVEDYQPKQCCDEIITRAFANINDIITKTQHLLCAKGRVLAMKGIYPTAELAALTIPKEKITVHSLQVPELSEQRHLISIQF